MRILLDTHILIWCLTANPAMSQKAIDIINGADKVYVSVANIWEIVIKQSVGKLKIDITGYELLEAIKNSGFEFLDIKPQHAIKLLSLEDHHRDPFDRMLIAQSLTEPLHLLTIDDKVAQYHGNIIKL